MSRWQMAATAASVAATVLLAAAGGSWAQETLSARLDASGMIQVFNGDDALAMIELNAHGPDWQHAPQEIAEAEVGELADGAGQQFTGTLPVPNTNGGAIEYTQTVETLPRGLQLEYDLTMTTAMKLNGLQLSIYLPVAGYAGKELQVARPDREPWIVGLPEEQPERNFQLWRGDGAKIDIAGGTEEAVTVELRAAADIVVQDLRQWERPLFEVRLPAIMEQEGRDVAAGDKFHLDLTVSLPGPVELEGP